MGRLGFHFDALLIPFYLIHDVTNPSILILGNFHAELEYDLAETMMLDRQDEIRSIDNKIRRIVDHIDHGLDECLGKLLGRTANIMRLTWFSSWCADVGALRRGESKYLSKQKCLHSSIIPTDSSVRSLQRRWHMILAYNLLSAKVRRVRLPKIARLTQRWSQSK